MEKVLLKKEKDLYKLLDKIYNIIPNNNISKAVYKSKEEQYNYQTSYFEMPPLYPCIMIYDYKSSNYSDWRKEHLYNKEYLFLTNVIYITLDDFNSLNIK